jgi:hypothetical protein
LSHPSTAGDLDNGHGEQVTQEDATEGIEEEEPEGLKYRIHNMRELTEPLKLSEGSSSCRMGY